MKGIPSNGSLSPLKNIFLGLLNGSVKKIQLYYYSIIDLIIIVDPLFPQLTRNKKTASVISSFLIIKTAFK